jgi:glycosyltransferase involved in cell wall biosynthesis
MTSHFEGYPAVLVEALACGTPAVVTPCSPALGDILPHASMGAIVQPELGAIACALEGMLRRPRPMATPQLLIARHDEARAAAAYLALMDQVCDRGGGGEA